MGKIRAKERQKNDKRTAKERQKNDKRTTKASQPKKACESSKDEGDIREKRAKEQDPNQANPARSVRKVFYLMRSPFAVLLPFFCCSFAVLLPFFCRSKKVCRSFAILLPLTL